MNMNETPKSNSAGVSLIRALLIDRQRLEIEAATLEQLCQLLRAENPRDDISLWLKVMLNTPACHEHVQSIDTDAKVLIPFPSLLEQFFYFLVTRCFSEPVTHDAEAPTMNSDSRGDDILSPLQLLLNAFCARTKPLNVIRAFSFIVGHIQVPQIRQKVFLLGFEVVNGVEHKAYSQSLAEALSSFLLLGASDIWSAVRKDTAGQIERLSRSKTPLYTAKDVDKLLDRLLLIASAPEESHEAKKTAWRSKHGALMMLCKLLCCFRVSELPTQNQIGAVTVSQSIRGKYAAARHTRVTYSFGSHILFPRHLPRSLIESGKKVLYRCLLHEQQNVREQAANALSLFINLCDNTTRVTTFQELLSKLHLMNADKSNEDSGTHNVPKLLDCHVAEGYLDALVQVIPSLDCEFLLRHWSFINSTLDRYVMHVASSVRQNASLIIEALMHKAIQKIDTSDKDGNDAPGLAMTLLIQIITTIKNGTAQPLQDLCLWQGREGQLLCVETITNILGRDLLLSFEYPETKLLATPHVKNSHRWNQGDCLHLSSADQDLKLWQWAHEEPHHATWMVDNLGVCISWQRNHLAHRSVDNGRRSTIVDLINVDIQRNRSDTSCSYRSFWKKVFTGFLQQIMCCCTFKQFELQRMIKQTLGGLVRLLLWLEICDKPDENGDCCIDILKEEVVASGNPQMTRWVVRFLCFHIRFLQEHLAIEGQDTAGTTKLITHLINVAISIVTELLSTTTNADLFDSNSFSDNEAWVMAIQAPIAAFVVISSHKTHTSHLNLVHQALDVISVCQTRVSPSEEALKQHCKPISLSIQCNRNSLDRILSISLVRMIPSFVAAYLEETHGMKPEVSSKRSWKLLQIISGWLLSEDSLRWIMISKTDAHWYLLSGLHMLFRSSYFRENHQEFISCCLTITEEFCKTSRSMDSIIVHQVCEISLLAWEMRESSVQSQVLFIFETMWLCTEKSRTDSDTSVWADWDEDQVETGVDTDTKVSMPDDKELLNTAFAKIRLLGHKHLAEVLSKMHRRLSRSFVTSCLGLAIDSDTIDSLEPF